LKLKIELFQDGCNDMSPTQGTRGSPQIPLKFAFEGFTAQAKMPDFA
jgi:hypothetical protein